jgi:hypothetical protein
MWVWGKIGWKHIEPGAVLLINKLNQFLSILYRLMFRLPELIKKPWCFPLCLVGKTSPQISRINTKNIYFRVFGGKVFKT